MSELHSLEFRIRRDAEIKGARELRNVFFEFQRQLGPSLNAEDEKYLSGMRERLTPVWERWAADRAIELAAQTLINGRAIPQATEKLLAE